MDIQVILNYIPKLDIIFKAKNKYTYNGRLELYQDGSGYFAYDETIYGNHDTYKAMDFESIEDFIKQAEELLSEND